jgi:transcriptional accessory protein Tex/SPT6
VQAEGEDPEEKPQTEASQNPPAYDSAAITDSPPTEPLNLPGAGAIPQAAETEIETDQSSPTGNNAETADASDSESVNTAQPAAASQEAESEAAPLQPAVDDKKAPVTESTDNEDMAAPDVNLPTQTSAASVPKPEPETEDPGKVLKDLVAKHNIKAISIGIGAGSRQLEATLRRIVQEDGLGDIIVAAVNDAGIAIYSSSRIAREEFPDWSASARCAVSLARRLQDPLGELVKIDPKLIGVGQYQHDVDQKALHRGLLQTVQYCVNRVGVNLNTASDSLLRYVSGLNDKLARRLVAHRNTQGPFPSRASMLSAVGMDEITYQQAAGFVRIPDGENPLDRTAVHPESYSIVEKMASALGVEVDKLIGNKELISSLKLEDFVEESVGIPTLNDIRDELLRPGRDPRKTFKVPKFRADIKEMSDLKPGMALEGTVTNVTNFGAFVDVGVRQDGLVHLSQMSNRFIRDPREAVKVGDVVQVKVISVESETKRIGLSMKAMLPTSQRRRKKQRRNTRRPMQGSQSEAKSDGGNTAGDASAAASGSGRRQKPNRPHQGSSRNRRRGPRKQGNPEGSQSQKESNSKTPEPTLQEKIAILQSKFRRID